MEEAQVPSLPDIDRILRGDVGRFFIILTVVSVLCVCPDESLAMGAKGGPVPSEENGQVGEGSKGQKGEIPGRGGAEEGIQREKDEGKAENTVPKKKPRLKYRDPFDCAC